MRFWTVGVLMLMPAAAAAAAQVPTTSCTACHGSEDWTDAESVAIVQAFENDVHAEVGLSCHDCHGGNPDPELAEDLLAAMDEEYSENPYLGVPARQEHPHFCGRCHSNPVYMKRFRPDIRVDQEREYWTSQHGQALRQGDSNVATCIDCHGVHGILRADNTQSPVYPSQVAETCRSCHADPERMSGYTLAAGAPLPIDQYARWRQSVHAKALYDKEDLTAPTCNDCHGNHGATPPGLDSVAFVCGQCHGREAELFRSSPKREGFEEHNENMEAAGAEGCRACHDTIELEVGPLPTQVFSECSSCHGNHGVVRPTVTMLALVPETPCAFCHDPTGPLAAEFPEPEKKGRRYEEQRDLLLEEARRKALEGEERFDWLVERLQQLPFHTETRMTEEGEETRLRPEFRRLFEKFRIGKSHYTYVDPASGQVVRAKLRSCNDCHSSEPDLGEEPVGLLTALEFLDRMQELTSLTARAERIALEAHRGGVEVRSALQEIDQAVDSQIELEVLVHTFSAEEDSAFIEKHQEGLGHARAALEAGQEALQELTFRRRGLAVSLVFIALVLVALALKIRQLPPSG